MVVTRQEGPGGSALWLAALEDVSDREWSGLYTQMDPARQHRCDRYRRPVDRKLCVLADALARHALGQVTGQDPASIVFQCQEGGKPFAPGVGIEFSLSHSGSLALCATAPFPVGADLQLHRPLRPALPRRMARAGYQGSGEADFFAWWVRQEAAGKLEGTGLSLRPLTGERDVRSGTLEEDDGRYFYCVCGPKGAFL